jgi:hypothetical protein
MIVTIVKLINILMIASLLFITTIWAISILAFFIHRTRNTPIMNLVQMYIVSRVCSLFKKPPESHVLCKNDHYEVVYSIGELQYRLYLKRGVTISPIITAITLDRGENVTKIVNQYLGYCRNFHGVLMTPRMMGLPDLRITYRTFEDKVVNIDEVIPLN